MQIPTRKPGTYTNVLRDPYMTQAKFNELKAQLDRLLRTRPGAASEVRRLAEMGDFSENAAYQHAKGRLRGINQRIMEIEDHLRQAKIIAPQDFLGTIQLGSIVTIELAGKTSTFQILGPTETNPSKKIISHKSPLGAALLGKQAGEEFTVVLGGKQTKVKVVRVAV